jgi:hypothetical protein
MDEERLVEIRGFALDLVEELFATGNYNHLDGYGGASLVIDLEEAVTALHKKGWAIARELGDG